MGSRRRYDRTVYDGNAVPDFARCFDLDVWMSRMFVLSPDFAAAEFA